MKKVYLKTLNNDLPLYWGGNGWWTRRRDQAKAFDSPQEAQAELARVVTVEIEQEETADAAVAEA